jgi:hypothetical protein
MGYEGRREYVMVKGFPETLPSQDTASKLEILRKKLLVKLSDP